MAAALCTTRMLSADVQCQLKLFALATSKNSGRNKDMPFFSSSFCFWHWTGQLLMVCFIECKACIRVTTAIGAGYLFANLALDSDYWLIAWMSALKIWFSAGFCIMPMSVSVSFTTVSCVHSVCVLLTAAYRHTLLAVSLTFFEGMAKLDDY